MTGEILAAGGGFLLAVLWFDLMFDVQALRGPRSQPLPEATLASIAGYYRRVTTEASPMGRLVGVIMLATIAAALVDLVRGAGPLAARVGSVALLVAPVALAGLRVFPNAARLGARSDSSEEQSRLARAIARDHLACLAAIVAFLAVQLGT
jgi:hypothetical protein